MNKYRTIDGLDYTITDVGRTENGVIETDAIIENPNFELEGEVHNVEVTAIEAPAEVLALPEPEPETPQVMEIN